MPFEYYKSGCQTKVNCHRSTIGALTTIYDSYFAAYGKGIPVSFLRVLAKRESNMNSKETKGKHWGLLQVSWKPGGTLEDYNKTHKTNYTKNDLLNPEINIRIASWELNRIIRSYQKYHGFKPSFKNISYVELLLAGWNSGYSEKSGVGKMLGWLKKNRKPINLTNLYKYASKVPGITQHLLNRNKMQWQHSVAEQYRIAASLTRKQSKPESLLSIIVPAILVPAGFVVLAKNL